MQIVRVSHDQMSLLNFRTGRWRRDRVLTTQKRPNNGNQSDSTRLKIAFTLSLSMGPSIVSTT